MRLSYREVLEHIQAAVMQQRIMPVPVPILKKDAIELEIQPRVRRAQIHRHIPRRIRVDGELMYAPRLDRNLSILSPNLFPRPVNFDAHQASFDTEVFGLELVKVQQRAFWSMGAIEKPTEVVGYGGFDVMFVSLAEEEASSWWGFEKFGRE